MEEEPLEIPKLAAFLMQPNAFVRGSYALRPWEQIIALPKEGAVARFTQYMQTDAQTEGHMHEMVEYIAPVNAKGVNDEHFRREVEEYMTKIAIGAAHVDDMIMAMAMQLARQEFPDDVESGAIRQTKSTGADRLAIDMRSASEALKQMLYLIQEAHQAAGFQR